MIFRPPQLWVWLAFASCVSRFALAADAQPPAVAITQPSSGATLSGKSIMVEVTASDASGVTNVALKVNGAAFGAPSQASPYIFAVDTTKLANGMHTMMAVATDGVGNVARSTIISVTATNPPRYTLGQGPFVLEDLGSLLSANTQEKQIMFRLPNGDLHLLLYYVVTEAGKYPLQILDVNLSQGTTRLTDGILGRPGPNATVLHPNGKIYLGSSDPGYFLEYDPLTGATNFIGKLHPTLRRDAQVAEIGDDGCVYVGEYSPLGGGLARYNPTNAVFEDLGLLDTNYNAPQYSYTVGADNRYVYVGLGQQPWYLAIYDTQTTNTVLYWKSENDTGGRVSRGIAGGFYYWRRMADATIKWYQLAAGQPTEIAATNVPPLFQYYERGNVIYEPANFRSHFGVEINLDDAYPDSSSNHAIVRWRTVGASNWQSVDVSGFRLQPINIKRLYPLDTNRMFGFADFYGPVFAYNIQDTTTTTFGRPQYSLYDALFEVGNIYLSGYTAVTLNYDSFKPWSLSGSTTNRSDPEINPHQIPGGFGKYHYYSTFGADGLVYIGGHHERDSSGGELGWYDPINGTNGRLRQPFLANDVRDLKPALGGTKLVYASNQTNLYVFDVATKAIERTIVPLPNATALDKIVEVSPGIILGAAGSNIFKVDITDGSILYTNTLPGLAFGGSVIRVYDRRLSLGPDGFVWMFIGNSLYRINPSDGSTSLILNTSAKTILFKEGDLYLYGGPNLYRIQNVLAPIVPPPSALRVLPPP
ncbi:MAG: hypothetical protein IH623_16355 [Verrucomicrobia bacterium]|nr:hypothetical protein [Verrucomicrobiota bacterium]